MQLASSYTERTISIDLSEKEAGKLMYLLLFHPDWETDLHGGFARDLHDELEELGVDPFVDEE
ncbi:hypothetical protein [Micromonospora sp. CB01531]|uniref:hypothetical protein n=1 Tax=Micromonospora sp. CB01531 TaxID=1718947 RepID=UPI000938BB70|nr:hypothetical protein [Micromonospora sp. CB01531]OKI54549.1 hypothetical protein A6A27_31990 [Micromonospora sp. CB01531]